MIFPKTLTEIAMYNSVRLVTSTGSGTGFFFTYIFDEGEVPILVTNKHVVNNNPNEIVKLLVHTGDNKTKTVFDESIEVTLNLEWFFHSKHDLCFCYVAPIAEYVKQRYNKEIYYSTIEKNLIPDKEKLEELSAVENVVMVGYPIGLWDSLHNLPLFRRGITSTHPAYDFNVEGVGVVDMACFPGSSGSPIFIIDENGYSDKQGKTYIGAKRILFLGILFEGPQLTLEGDVKVIQTKDKVVSHTNSLVNLGYYIKTYELIEFEEVIKKEISK